MLNSQKFHALDGLRGLAAIFVLNRHAEEYWGGVAYHSYLAVDLFFLLSGFVIAHSYERKLASGSMSSRNFVVTRIIRLYPLYFMSLLLAFAVSSQLATPEVVARSLFMVPSFGEGSLFPLDVVYWSLFFELVVNGIYIIARPKLTDKVLGGIVVAFGVALVYLARREGGNYLGFEGVTIHFVGGFVRAVFGIFLGVLMYRHRRRLSELLPRFFGPVGALAAACAVLALPSAGRFDWAIDAFAVLVVFPLCVVGALGALPPRAVPVLSLLGAASYPLYLFHPMLAKVGLMWLPASIPQYTPLSGLVFAVTVVVISVGLNTVDAWIRARLTEWVAPFRRSSKTS